MSTTESTENPIISASYEMGKTRRISELRKPEKRHTTRKSEDISDLKLSLEKEGTQKVIELMQTNPVADTTFQQSLVGIMRSGNQKFLEQTGRNLTYSEMRELYG